MRSQSQLRNDKYIMNKFLIGVIENLIMCTCIQNFDSVASHLELAILSRKFRITEHAQSSAVEYFNFFSIEINLSLQDLHFHQVMGIMLQKQLIY